MKYFRLNILLLVVIYIFTNSLIQAQTKEEIDALKREIAKYKPGQSTFLLRGYAHSGLEILDENSTFVGGSFNPIFLWKQSDKLLFESELELELEDGETVVGLEYADMSYFLNNYITLRLGKFLIPFGTFGAKLHPRWINRLPSNPLGYTHSEQVGPISQVGVEIRGAIPIRWGNEINYSIYLVNGPNLNDGSEEPEEAGKLHYNNYIDNNKNKAIGGRIGFLPFNNASLEIGLSTQFGKVGDSNSKYQNISAQLFSFDLSYVNNIYILKSILDVKGQWNRVEVDNANYLNADNPSETYTFNNISNAYYTQVSLKPAFVNNNLINHLEFVARYSKLKLPLKAIWGGEKTQLTFGINYWLDWRTVIKLGYQTMSLDSSPNSPNVNSFLIHWSLGF